MNGSHAALLNNDVRSEIVNITFNLKDEINRGSEVDIPIDHKARLTSSQWLITHLGREEYKIQNADFKSFAGYDPNPQIEDQVLGKADPVSWTVRLAQSPNIYT